MRVRATNLSRLGIRTLLVVVSAVGLVACGAEGNDSASAQLEAGSSGSGPTFDVSAVTEVIDGTGASMGSVAFPVSCTEEASASMRLGLALLHNMTYTEAASAFERAAEQDPACALAHWGVAMTYLHPLWPDVPSDAHLESGWERLQEARSVGLKTAREEDYVAALEAYYRDAGERPEPARLASYAQEWERVRSAHPADPEATLFAALSLIATAPGSERPMDKWEAGGAAAERVLAAIPDHPGAHHYVIHSYDVPQLAERALPAARSYGRVAPDNAHALHMTSHIFTRVGSWEESIDYNTRSADAAAKHPINGATSHHHLHAVDYLAYAYLQRAEDDRAEQVLDHLAALDGPVVDHAASAYAFAAVPARIALERQDWERAAAVQARWPATVDWDRYPHLEAIPEFARALGSAHTGDIETAERAIARLGDLAAAAAALPGSYDWGTQVKIQEVAARAWVAYAQDRSEDALALMTEAAMLESGTTKNPVTPGEALPATELLGDLLLELGHYEEARRAYEKALERSPNRFNSLFGAGRAAELGGEHATAAEYYRRLLSVTAEGADAPGVRHASEFLG